MTLTFDPKRVYPVNCRTASREAFGWCNDSARLLRLPLAWVYAPERSASGQWHAHVLIAAVPLKALRVPLANWRLRNGFAHAQEVSRLRRAALYTTKEAALTGEVVWADTLGRYRHHLRDAPFVTLHPLSPRPLISVSGGGSDDPSGEPAIT